MCESKYAVPASSPFLDVGSAFPGTNGYPVQLVSGDLTPDSAFDFRLENGLPGGLATLVFGFTQANLSFKGGTMVPYPDLLIFGNLMDANGHASIAGTWPAGLPSGIPFWTQYWFKDSGAQNNETGTSAVRSITP